MKELVVFLHGEPVGVLKQSNEGNRTFQYLENSNPLLEVSVALPYRSDPYSKKATDAFIEGLLPEGEGVRNSLASKFNISSENPFTLLEKIGLECAGAIQFTPLDALDSVQQGLGTLTPCTEEEIGRRIRNLASDPKSSWILRREQWSLGGAQSKFALRWNDGWFEATGAEPTTHIFKPGIHDLKDQALNEHLCLRTLAMSGITVADSHYKTFDGAPAIVLSRYDRVRRGNRVVRIHQEDFCQATSTLPKRKYESNRGPTAIKIIHTLRQAGAGEDEVHRFVEGLIGNYLLGAPDAHAKNYSIILDSGRIALAPLYDVASGFPYEHRDHDGFPGRNDGLQNAAMAIGGERRFGRVARRHWARFAHDAKLDEDWVVTTVAALALLIPQSLEAAITEQHEAMQGSELPERLYEPVHSLCEKTINLLTS